MELKQLQIKLREKLAKSTLSAHLLLDKFRLIDESSRKSSAYTDPKYIPFYYHLGTLIEPKTVLEIGFRLGLFSGCFVKGCKTVEKILGFQQRSDTFYSERLGRANVKDNFSGELDIHFGTTTDEVFSQKLAATKWDLVIINEELSYDDHLKYLDLVWPHVSDEGIVVVDYLSRHPATNQALKDFCMMKNREFSFVPTPYGVGLVQK
jgi:predicted O-methyltransferase YrrM